MKEQEILEKLKHFDALTKALLDSLTPDEKGRVTKLYNSYRANEDQNESAKSSSNKDSPILLGWLD